MVLKTLFFASYHYYYHVLEHKLIALMTEKMNFSLPKKFNLMHLGIIIFVSIVLGALIGMFFTPHSQSIQIQSNNNSTNLQENQPSTKEITSKSKTCI